MKNAYDIFKSLIQEKHIPVKYVADFLNLKLGTVLKWKETQFVPFQYYFELCKIAKVDVDYTQFSEREKDQFFTPNDTAKYCYERSCQILQEKGVDISSYHFIEPSAGSGSFFDLLPLDRRTGIDIEPRNNEIVKSDFLEWYPNTQNNICIGNPPFGMRGHLALKFINHASQFCDFVCFILPQNFNSDGKGSCKSRVKNLNLIHSEKIQSTFIYPSGKKTNVNVIFQIWSKLHQSVEVKRDLKRLVKLYSLSDGNLPSQKRNKKHIDNCDFYLPSTCFGENKMKLYKSYYDLPQRRGYGIKIISNHETMHSAIESIDWNAASFKSTNGAYNLRFDLIETAITEKLNET